MLNQRIQYIDIAKGIGILLVVIGHCINSSSFPGRWIWSFHMPLFFVISGLCFNPSKNPLFVPFLLKKSKTLLLPLVIFSILMVVIKSVIFPSEFNFATLKTNFPDAAYWFIFVLFLSEILFFTINKVSDNKHVKFILLFICLIIGKLLNIYHIYFPYNLCSIFACTFFYGIGNIFGATIHSILDNINTNGKSIIISIILLLIPAISVYYLNNTIDLRSNTIPFPILYHVLIAFIGTTGIFLLSKFLSGRDSLIKTIVLYLGRNTLIILLLHMCFINISANFISPLIPNRIAYKIIELIFISILLYFSIQIINHKLKWLIGKF